MENSSVFDEKLDANSVFNFFEDEGANPVLDEFWSANIDNYDHLI